jgi:hypothetical protein
MSKFYAKTVYISPRTGRFIKRARVDPVKEIVGEGVRVVQIPMPGGKTTESSIVILPTNVGCNREAEIKVAKLSCSELKGGASKPGRPKDKKKQITLTDVAISQKQEEIRTGDDALRAIREVLMNTKKMNKKRTPKTAINF